ncbi:MAG: outer membrane protein transport protein [Limnobacter sp.]|jgi:long-chain fatty acid transport protein|uniref:OmpP1/FadL family transporter n=2 Tax=Burkholderiaceae TaxID=119060 RepID=UPI000156C8FA|nr:MULTISPECIES: outer membrane protein transport protein [Limnobacter]EDM84789.1 long chain fatty acid transport protein [Limnobacter sp. MED105]MAZ08687.1 long-chain fatty acid transporter [Sutterellaceae bacterium]MDP3272815.1 outer membrane protein transport protein [Limnobacter sp.]MDZ4057942.1 outer membrane protein transport protein [Polynucleobacter sp.]|tara:strand:+ start:6575 stop:8062 length:1488 start_codon:yes stop_codon:yes gene_type:complete
MNKKIQYCPNFKMLIVGALTATPILSFLSSKAYAGGTAFDATSISSMGSANAGMAAEAGDASVLFANPAALTRLKRAEVVLGAAFVGINTSYTSGQTPDGSPTNSGTTGSAGQEFNRKSGYDSTALAPNLFVAIPITKKLVVGFGGAASHALIVRYDENFPGRNQGRDIDFKVSRANLGFGYKLTPTLSIGANGSYERYFQSLKLKLNYRDAVDGLLNNGSTLLDGLNAAGLAPPIPEEADLSLRMFGWAFNAQAGALWEPTINTRIGISYRPKTEFTGMRGKLKIQETAEGAEFREFLNGGLIGVSGPLLGVNGPQAAGDLLPEQRIKQDITLPDELRLSIFHHASPKLDLMASYTRQDFSVTNLKFVRESNGRVLQEIQQNYVAANSYRVGLNYKAFKRLVLKAGYAVENSVIDDDTRITLLPDSDRQYFGLGAQLELRRDTTLNFSYMKFDLEPGATGANGQVSPAEVRGGDFQGTTKLDIDFFGVSITERF